MPKHPPVNVMKKFFHRLTAEVGIMQHHSSTLHSVSVHFDTQAEAASFYNALQQTLKLIKDDHA